MTQVGIKLSEIRSPPVIFHELDQFQRTRQERPPVRDEHLLPLPFHARALTIMSTGGVQHRVIDGLDSNVAEVQPDQKVPCTTQEAAGMFRGQAHGIQICNGAAEDVRLQAKTRFRTHHPVKLGDSCLFSLQSGQVEGEPYRNVERFRACRQSARGRTPAAQHYDSLNVSGVMLNSTLRLDGTRRGARRGGPGPAGDLRAAGREGVDPYTCLVDVLQRVGEHPASRATDLTPRVWKMMFADDPLRSDLDRARDPPSG